MLQASATAALLTLAVVCRDAFAASCMAALSVRHHLATRARYNWASSIPGAQHIAQVHDPPGYSPAFLYLVSRHGTRWPTKDRMLQMNGLEQILKAAAATSEYPWLKDFKGPYRDLLLAGGELHPVGEQEMHDLGWRLHQRFPGLLQHSYLPRRFPIISTQVPRAAASASAFAAGFFPSPAAAGPQLMCGTSASRDETVLGGPLSCMGPPPRLQPVAITMAPKKADPLLRFFDVCPAFLHHEDYTERWMATWMTQTLRHLGPKLQHKLRTPRPPNPREVDALWQLCLAEAGLQDHTEGACQLFDAADVRLLEWVEDVRVWETQGHGAEVNYRMAGPLLADMLASVKAAATGGGSGEVARLLFAHAETLVPLAALMGLFRGDLDQQAPRKEVAVDSAEYERGGHIVEQDILDPEGVDTLEDAPLAVHPPVKGDDPPYEGPSYFKGREAVAAPVPQGWQPAVPRHQHRVWKGSRVSPYGANLAVVLYKPYSGGARLEDHLVRLLYNEQVLPLPGCAGITDCPLDQFLEAFAPAASPSNISSACGSRHSGAVSACSSGLSDKVHAGSAAARAAGGAAAEKGSKGGRGSVAADEGANEGAENDSCSAGAAETGAGAWDGCKCAASVMPAGGDAASTALEASLASRAA